MKEMLKKIWEIVYVDYRKYKLSLIERYDYVRVIANAYKTLEDDEGYEKYNNLVNEYKKLMDKIDSSTRESAKHDGSMFTWIKVEFINAVIKSTNIELERKIYQDESLYNDDYRKCYLIIYIVYELMQSADEEILDNNIEIVQINNKTEYRVKGITLFTDDVLPTEKESLFHGTTLYNAKNIIGMNKLLSKKYDGVNGFYNKDKIFFTESLTDSKKYALRSQDVLHIILEIDVKEIDLYKREHLLAKREGVLYFANQDSLDLADRIIKIYAVAGDKVEEITKEDIVKYATVYYSEEELEELNMYKKLIVDLTETSEKVNESIKNKIIELAEKENISIEEMANRLNMNKKLYEDIFGKRVFNSLEEHIEYLKELNLYQDKNNRWYALDIKISDEKNLYHGTTIDSAKKILTDRMIKPTPTTSIVEIDYNKIFFSDNINYTKQYGAIGSSRHINNKNHRYIILMCDLSDYTVYSFVRDEFMIWGSISSDCIKHMYLCEGDTILREISKKELLSMEA
ncbi:hypothetical protein AAK964_12210 [Tissierella praeacuta]|uniref:hypothetical protein n=1 Tax=Tissierella praeacuta TaxID=43131 RepID=UPI003519C60B